MLAWDGGGRLEVAGAYCGGWLRVRSGRRGTEGNDADARRHWVMRHSSPPNHLGGAGPVRKRVPSRYFGSGQSCCRRASNSAAWTRRLLQASPWGPGYYGSAQFPLNSIRLRRIGVRLIVSYVAC